MSEYIFVLGAEKRKRLLPPDPNLGTFFLGTLSMLLRLLKDKDLHFVTIFDFATGKRHNVIRYPFTAPKEYDHWLTSPLPPPEEGSIHWVWKYLESKDVPCGTLRALEFICHSDFNALAVRGGCDSYRMPELDRIPEATRKTIRSKLAKDCHIKIWGCSSYDMGDSLVYLDEDSDRITGRKYRWPAKFSRKDIRCDELKKYIRGLPHKLNGASGFHLLVWQFRRVLQKWTSLAQIPTRLEKDWARIQKYARKVHREGFAKKGSPPKWTSFSFPAVALSEFLNRPVYAPPWGFPSGTRSSSQLGLNPPRPADFGRTENGKWYTWRGSKVRVLVPAWIEKPEDMVPNLYRFYRVFFPDLKPESSPPLCYHSYLYKKLWIRRVLRYDYKRLQETELAADWEPEEMEEALALPYPDTGAYPVDLFEYPEDYPVDLFEYPETYPS